MVHLRRRASLVLGIGLFATSCVVDRAEPPAGDADAAGAGTAGGTGGLPASTAGGSGAGGVAGLGGSGGWGGAGVAAMPGNAGVPSSSAGVAGVGGAAAGAGGFQAGTGAGAGTSGAGGEAATSQGGLAGVGAEGGSGGGAGESSGGSAGSTAGTASGGAGQAGAGGGGSTEFSVCSSAPPAGTRVVSVYVIGDSTASVYAMDVYPRTGWAQVFGDWFAPACAVVKDKALSGRSSKSFFDEGAWTPVKDALLPGDFVLIQFGHNDEKSDDPARFTDPQTTYKQYLTTYVNDTRAKQASPVLLTSIHRNGWTGTMLKDSHGAYLPAVRELATALGVPLIDAAVLTETYFERIGQTATTALFMNLAAGESPNYPDGNSDNTHLKETGARAVAGLVAFDAYQQRLPLGRLLDSVPVAP